MKLCAHIHKIKSIEDLEVALPVDKGLYAITGQNGSGKSTIVACASRVFFNLEMNDYFGRTDEDAFIEFEMNGATRAWRKDKGTWKQTSSGEMNIKGFFEGSLIFGNRFRDTTYEKLKKVDKITEDKLTAADEFIRINLGNILQGDPNFYEKLWVVSSKYENFGYLFFYEKNGRRINQFHMSTGENLLISVLNSLRLKIRDKRNEKKACIIFLDEIELALHPSSLKRLVVFLNGIANQYNYAIYFSTHSLELISGIDPNNIFYIERHADNSMEVINPCYPAYATKFLYDHSGYDNVILVEDDLAREIIRRILKKESMMNNKLIHVLPCGGWNNVLTLADDVVRNNLLGKKASICIILDKDIQDSAKRYIASKNIGNNIAINYLPIESFEKYLRTRLVITVDHKLYRLLNDYVFQQKSLSDIINEYKVNQRYHWENDRDGKTLYKLLDSELRERNKNRIELIEMVVDYLFENDVASLKAMVEFLHKQLD